MIGFGFKGLKPYKIRNPVLSRKKSAGDRMTYFLRKCRKQFINAKQLLKTCLFALVVIQYFAVDQVIIPCADQRQVGGIQIVLCNQKQV
jgi:hypothetical protein